MIRQLDSLISLPATDVPRAVRFYTEVLGATPVVEVPERGFYIFTFPHGDGVIGIHRHAGPLPAPDLDGHWFWLRVPVLDTVMRRMRDAGVRFLGEPSELGPGRQQPFLDSEGNVLRLFEPLDRVERSIAIDAPASTVFAALTTAAAIERWFSTIDDVVFEARLGGAVSFRDPVFGMVRGTVQAWDPPRGLTIEFTENWPSRLEYRLAARNGGTQLTVEQTDFEPIRERDFGIPGLVRRLEEALAALSSAAGGGSS